MNLVHVRVQLSSATCELDLLRQALRSHVLPGEAVEHISVHLEGGGALTVGFWVDAPSTVACEQIAYTVAHRALTVESTKHPGRITSYSTALVPELFDRILQGDPPTRER